jgi:hypothetical protein
VFPDERVARFINEHFVPARVHVKEQAEDFKRLGDEFKAFWTPTQLILEPDRAERHRLEGFLPTEDFLAQLTLGLAKTDFARQKWSDAENRFREVVEKYPDTSAAPEALYWAGVSRYKRTNDPAALRETANEFTQRYTDSDWAKRTTVWQRQPAGAT